MFVDMPAHLVHNKRLPRRVYPYSVRTARLRVKFWAGGSLTRDILQLRQLLGERNGRWQAYQPGTLGYCRPRRLRQTPTSFVSSDRRLPHLLFHRQPPII